MAPAKARDPLTGWPGPTFHVRATFRAPLDFVYRWCTDYSAEDPALEGQGFRRKVLERTPRRAVYEDLEEGPNGWDWSRDVVTLHPPRAWELDERGNRTEAAARYLLSERPDGRVQLDIWWRRRALVPPAVRLTKAQRERRSTISWQRFSRALERDYRAQHHLRRRP
ncbi:MAG: hypothetical protein L3K06_00430 [Thermoplasmata archaeon]|nr:hypothetical protein [Thermoplasmata archaeon]